MTQAPTTARRKKVVFGMRRTRVARTLNAGCFVCNGPSMMWSGGNAQGVAARHHDATGHETWCDVGMSIRYGGDDT